LSSIFSKPKNALEILEFRKALEIECLKLGIKKAEASDVEALESIFGEYWNALCAEDYKKTVSYDYRFHHQVFLMSKNSLFIEIYESMSELFFLHSGKTNSIIERPMASPLARAGPSGKVLEAFRNRDQRAAVEASRK